MSFGCKARSASSLAEQMEDAHRPMATLVVEHDRVQLGANKRGERSDDSERKHNGKHGRRAVCIKQGERSGTSEGVDSKTVS
jgi:hypothetical protein